MAVIEADRCLEVTDGIQRFGFLVKFKDDDRWLAFDTLPGENYHSDLIAVCDTPQEAFKALADIELKHGYSIKVDAPEELLRD